MKERIKQILRIIFKTTTLKRQAFFLLSDIILIVFSMYASFWFRFDGNIPEKYIVNLKYYILLAVAIKLGFLIFFRLYNISWRFFSLRDLIKLSSSIIFSSLALGLMLFFLKTYKPFIGFPRSIILLDFILTMGFLGTIRISKRALQECKIRVQGLHRGGTRILIIGAGSAGEQIGREMLHNNGSKYLPVGYIDDNTEKKGITIHGIKILGTRKDIPHILTTHRIDEVLIALPSVYSKDIKDIVKIIRESNHVKKIKILPSLANLLDGKVTISDIQEIEIDDLLGRDPVHTNFDTIKDFLYEKRVLITGAGGSIGTELSKTVSKFKPESLGLLEIDETELFLLMNKLDSTSSKIVPLLGNINDAVKMRAIFEKFQPEIIIHSAAYKQVPMLEDFPEEAVKTNVLGTKILVELSIEFRIEKFVYISTDKAINPTSIMGSTKRIGEELLRVQNGKSKTRFICVRFGNVLGSRGSVVQLFKEQISRGGPVIVTHSEMERYFMAIPEAVLLVLEASAMGKGGEAFHLDMSTPIKIVDLAKEMIKLSGYEPDVDIPIVYSGIRSGEKLYEELLSPEERSEPTVHPRIFRVRDSEKINGKELMEKIYHLVNLSLGKNSKEEIIACIKEIVPMDITNHGKEEELHERLSNREHEVIRAIASGKNVKEAARKMSLNSKMINTNLARSMKK